MDKILKSDALVGQKKSEWILDSCSPKHVKQLDVFHPTGKPVPDTSHIHKGFYYEASDKNRNSFIMDETIHDEPNHSGKFKGGVIVFPVGVHAETMSANNLKNEICQFWTTLEQRHNKSSIIHKLTRLFHDEPQLVDEQIYRCRVGSFFKGQYRSDDRTLFDENSIAVQVNGITADSLLLLAEYLCKSFRQATVLVKDFYADGIYLADNEKLETFADEAEIHDQ